MQTRGLLIVAQGIAACIVASASIVPGALAQAYPVKPIRIVIPYPAGGIDPVLRLMVPKMTEVLGQIPFVDNRPGANGLIGADFVSRAAPDGYTLLFVAPSTIISGVLLSKDFKLDPLKDFTPITELFGTKKVLVTHPSLPAGSLREVVEYAKRNPGKISYGSGGIGSTFHMDTEQFKLVTGIDMVHVPYKGTGPYTADLLAGRVQFGIIPLSNVRQHIASGKLRHQAMFEHNRDADYPGIPTIAEVFPSVARIGGWIGMFAPPALPAPILKRVYEATDAAMKTPEMKAFQDQSGGFVTSSPPEVFVGTLKSDYDKMAQLIKSIGLKPE
jgi:tripartite-type tricarboxylate transporter receptor subunit TctC